MSHHIMHFFQLINQAHGKFFPHILVYNLKKKNENLFYISQGMIFNGNKKIKICIVMHFLSQ
jgi:hypothetical protein